MIKKKKCVANVWKSIYAIHSILDLESLFKPYINDLQDILY